MLVKEIRGVVAQAFVLVIHSTVLVSSWWPNDTMGVLFSMFGGGDPGPIPEVNVANESSYTLPLGAPNAQNPTVWFDIEVGGQSLGRIEMELKADVVICFVCNRFSWL